MAATALRRKSVMSACENESSGRSSERKSAYMVENMPGEVWEKEEEEKRGRGMEGVMKQSVINIITC